ncbi:hypothetical protein OJ252_2546 [Cryptosporidium canis]|uniref:Uncharacterized protein n=1 Tax=Cryptosporidium canis TaxID=195482 RepID=A0ABQ8P5Z2_9CRYT|nr:hypothetical protein OJ252_2546 [Cryptosporidium canis]
MGTKERSLKESLLRTFQTVFFEGIRLRKQNTDGSMVLFDREVVYGKGDPQRSQCFQSGREVGVVVQVVEPEELASDCNRVNEHARQQVLDQRMSPTPRAGRSRRMSSTLLSGYHDEGVGECEHYKGKEEGEEPEPERNGVVLVQVLIQLLYVALLLDKSVAFGLLVGEVCQTGALVVRQTRLLVLHHLNLVRGAQDRDDEGEEGDLDGRYRNPKQDLVEQLGPHKVSGRRGLRELQIQLIEGDEPNILIQHVSSKQPVGEVRHQVKGYRNHYEQDCKECGHVHKQS